MSEEYSKFWLEMHIHMNSFILDDQLLLKEAACLFPFAQPLNNHTETTLSAILFGQ